MISRSPWPDKERPRGVARSAAAMWFVLSLIAMLMVFEVALSGATYQMLGK
jgi:hypothetical protein